MPRPTPRSKVPSWGFSSSPLIVDDMVVVAAAGKLAAYDLATGKPRWFGPNGGGSYSSPHLATIDGVEQIVLLSGPARPASSRPTARSSGNTRGKATPILQPAVLRTATCSSTAIARDGRHGHPAAGRHARLRRLERRRALDVDGLKPYFSDFVVHNGHAFGFDGRILSCIDSKTARASGRAGATGRASSCCCADQDLLLVLSEEGELGLVSATPDKFTEVARVPAIEGKTWNHPVLVRDTLLVRNDQEMAAFRLPLAGR